MLRSQAIHRPPDAVIALGQAFADPIAAALARVSAPAVLPARADGQE